MFDWLDAGHRIDFFLTLHNTESGEYLEGPDAPIARAVFEELVRSTTFHPSRGLGVASSSTTPGQAGRMSVNQGLYAERRIPAFLMEQRVEFNSKLNRYPTIEDRLEFGRQLVGAIASALAGPR
jgi:hypothetical protein